MAKKCYSHIIEYNPAIKRYGQHKESSKQSTKDDILQDFLEQEELLEQKSNQSLSEF